MRIRVKGKGKKIRVRRVRRRQVVDSRVWVEYMNNHDGISKEEWAIIRSKKER